MCQKNTKHFKQRSTPFCGSTMLISKKCGSTKIWITPLVFPQNRLECSWTILWFHNFWNRQLVDPQNFTSNFCGSTKMQKMKKGHAVALAFFFFKGLGFRIDFKKIRFFFWIDCILKHVSTARGLIKKEAQVILVANWSCACWWHGAGNIYTFSNEKVIHAGYATQIQNLQTPHSHVHTPPQARCARWRTVSSWSFGLIARWGWLQILLQQWVDPQVYTIYIIDIIYIINIYIY